MGSVFLRGDSWVIEYRKGDGRLKRESVGKRGTITKTLVKAILKNRERDATLEKEGLLDADPTLGDFTRDYLRYKRDTEKKPSWKDDEQALRLHLIPFFGHDRKLSEIKPQDVDDYKTFRLKQGAAPASVDRGLAVLNHLFNMADRWNKFYGKNPVRVARLLRQDNQKERTLNREEERRLLASANPHLRAIIICALNTGMRKSEIITLKWVNVDLEGGVITLERENTKSKKMRRIPINSALRRLLLELRLKRAGSECVFLGPPPPPPKNKTTEATKSEHDHALPGKPYERADSLNQSFRGACRRAGIEGLRFHDLRHTAATRMIESGASVVAVSRILGHADLKTTMRYAHPEDSLKAAVESLVKNDYLNPATDKSTDRGEKG